MGIVERTQTVFRSNFNALLSRFEEPGRDIAWLLEEMKEQLQSAQRELIRVVGERKRSETRLTELSGEVEKWEKRAELAVRQGDDALAREALAQKQRLVLERDRLTATRAELQKAAIDMKSEVDRMKRTHQDYAARQGTIAAQVSQSRAGGGAQGLGGRPGENHFDAFARIENAIESDDALADAEREVAETLDRTALGTMTGTELDAQFKRLEEADTNTQVKPTD
ncbi:MAG TPA: PspA/IM30 family protein, partial [Polyangiaceae bacterium]|nr:PspA/IM30 family protein [Polyangiaceae bacterium]